MTDGLCYVRPLKAGNKGGEEGTGGEGGKGTQGEAYNTQFASPELHLGNAPLLIRLALHNS